MIKLFWNTHNQKKFSKTDINNKKYAVDEIWGTYHKNNSDKWIYEILKKTEFSTIEKETKLEKNDSLIIIDSSIEEKKEFYEKLKLICSKIYLFHLGDESGIHNFSPIYDKCDYVWRTFCINKYFENTKVKCIPLGYKSGVFDRNVKKRKYKWAFVGTPHKSSRHDLLFQFSDISPSFCHKTKKFNKEIISVEQMTEVLSSTYFIPCPNGFVHPETYRLYEALECGSIPIVENAYRYYDRLFPNNPFIKVDIWADAKPIINGWGEKQILKKQEECKIWWKNKKTEIQNLIQNKINP